MDEFIHWPTPTFSCQKLVMKYLLWMKNHLVSDSNGNIVSLISHIY